MPKLRKSSGLLAVIVMIMTYLLPGAVAQAAAHSLIVGSGSSWSANAVNQWVADVQGNGLQVVFTPNGSAQGRKDFAYKTTDFGVSDIGYLGTDPVTGESDTPLGRGYAYLPIVAGGTAFPYQVKVGGKLRKDIRLSGKTLALIFTNKITNWNDSAITADNNGRKLPSIPIIPVVHSEGSGSTAQFTRYLNAQYPSIWGPFLGKNEGTEYFPRKGQAIAQNGSDPVMNYVTSAAANGAIGYDEYSYALGKNYPVIKVLNANGYYTLPNQYNVAVALTKAVIDPKTLLQDLRGVYSYTDPRTYPLSSYSYSIIPTSASDPKMTSPKRQTLADFLFYSVCGGQKEMGPIGYSPLPLNLVKSSFAQIAKLRAADPSVDISKQSATTCNNPTFDRSNPNKNYLAEIAPQPPACDKRGAGPCGATTNAGTANPTNGRAPVVNSGGTSGRSTNGTRGTRATNGTAAPGGQVAAPGAAANGTGAGNPAAGTRVDPVTGQVVADTSVLGTDGQSGDAVNEPTDLADYRRSSSSVPYGVLAALMLVLVLIAPPLFARRLGGRAKGQT